MFDSRKNQGDRLVHPEAPSCDVCTHLDSTELELRLRQWGLTCIIDKAINPDMFVQIRGDDQFRVTVASVNPPLTELSFSDQIKRDLLIKGASKLTIE